MSPNHNGQLGTATSEWGPMNSREPRVLLFPCFFRYAWEFSLQLPVRVPERQPDPMAAASCLNLWLPET